MAASPVSTTTTGTYHVEILTRDQVSEAASVMAAAFVNTPSYMEIFRIQNEPNRRLALQWLLERNITAIQSKDPNALKGIVINGKIVATFCLLSPTSQPTLWDSIKVGLLWVPFKFGYGTYQRMMKATEHYNQDGCQGKTQKKDDDDDDDDNTTYPRSIHTYSLERMTVLPEWQGKGFGSNCVQHCIQHLQQQHNDNDIPAVQLVLATQEERNVHFYSKHGFQVAHEMDYITSDHHDDDTTNYNYHNWIMKWVPSSPPKK